MFTCKTSAVKQNSADPSVYVRLLDTVHSVPLGNMWVFHLLWKIIFTPNKNSCSFNFIEAPIYLEAFQGKKAIHKVYT